jgi:DNA polymerase III subunit epsilon
MPVLSTDLLAFYRQISQQVLTVVDLETTGCKSTWARAIEISVLQGQLGEGILHQQTHLINPQVLVPGQITEFTGISQQMVDTAPLATAVWPEYLPLLSQGVLTAHNFTFDYSFICQEYDRLGISFSRSAQQSLCTVKLARLLLSDLPSRSLPSLVAHFQFPVQESHRAAADTLACWLLAERLLQEISDQDDETVLARFGEQRLSIAEAARMLDCSQRLARDRLMRAGIKPFVSQRSGTHLYPRAAIEQLYWQSHQLSLPNSLT